MIEAIRVSLKNGLLFSEVVHGVVGVGFAFFLWYKTRSYVKSFMVFLISYLADIDHLIGYVRYYGWDFDLAKFADPSFYYHGVGEAILPFHSWELVILLGVLVNIRGWKSWSAPLFLGVFAHLLVDTFSNGLPAIFYSSIWRMINGFVFPV